MGSKNLKALAVYSANKIEVDNPEMMEKFVQQARKELNEEAFVRDELMIYGTSSFTNSIHASGLLPTRNWQYTTFDKMDKIGHAAYHEILKVKPRAC
ncbi:MAG: hypothetical protein GX240_00435 [Candidatus Atribacteria bacterium]|nr:hypothetical protein [Candidatus Atribacteria bacterium]